MLARVVTSSASPMLSRNDALYRRGIDYPRAGAGADCMHKEAGIWRLGAAPAVASEPLDATCYERRRNDGDDDVRLIIQIDNLPKSATPGEAKRSSLRRIEVN